MDDIERKARIEEIERFLKNPVVQDIFAAIEKRALEALAKADLTGPQALDIARTHQANLNAIRKLRSELDNAVAAEKNRSRGD